MSASFVYDGDGNRVKSIINGVSTEFIGNYYEVTPGAAVRKYYMAGASRVAMNVNGAIYFLLSDQLGSSTVTTDDQGEEPSTLRYKPWGEVRIPTSGVNPGPCDYTYTGQYSNVDDFDLMFYNARWYDPALGRFAQADSVVPDGVQGYDRYAYANNNPIVYNDPSGHCVLIDEDSDGLCLRQDNKSGRYHIVHSGQGRWANRSEVAIADFILSGDPTSLNTVPPSEGVFIGALTEGACGGLDIDCGDYYQRVFRVWASGVAAFSGVYPGAGTRLSSTTNTVPTNLVDDVYSSGGWVTGALPNIERTLDLINSGGPFPYKQDGKIFINKEGLLPLKRSGYYREYTVAELGAIYRGTERIVVGQNGEVYYTPDHYQTFYQIR